MLPRGWARRLALVLAPPLAIAAGCRDVDHHAPHLATAGARPPLNLSRPAIILKADDFGGPLSARAARFIELVDANGGVAALGIITARLPDGPVVLATYRDLDARGFELFFHGHRHDWSLPEAEFAGVGVEAQRAALRTGLAVARERLGVSLHAFGAPGNAVDDDTVVALRDVPEIRVWIFGRDGAGALVLPRLVELESEVGVVREPGPFFADLDRVIAGGARVVALQIHPAGLDDESFARLRTILAGLRERGHSFTTPSAWWRAQQP